MKIEFDEATHTYRLDGTIVPNVTSVIGLLKGYIPQDDHARLRGTYVHQACCFVDKGLLDWDSLSKPLVPYVEAYVKFRSDIPQRILRSEMVVYSASYRFAGTLDRVTKGIDGDNLYDLKTGQEDDVDALQTAAYAFAYEEMTGRTIKHRYALYLGDNGKHRLSHHDDPNDRVIFLSALNVANWANAHNKKGVCYGNGK
jgi:hypothetical protein